MRLTDITRLTLAGEFQERLQRSIRHLQELNTPEMRMEFTHPTDFWHWGADYMGRWISAMSLLGQYTGQDYGAASVAAELVAFQQPDGSFGPYTDPHDFQEWFGMGRGLVGLLEHYQTNPDPEILAAAERLGKYYVLYFPDCAACLYECYSTALEGLVRLADVTDEAVYLDTARRIADASVVYKGIRYSAEVAENGRRTPAAGQVHCQLSTARGLLDLYEATGEARYFEAVRNIHAYIVDELLWASGGIGFYYYRPEENETCADADWLRLNLKMWKLTSETKYMDLAERILLNQLYFNQADNGAFCYLRGLQNRAGAVFDACCSHHGPRAMAEVLRYIYTTDRGAVWINLFMDGSVRLDMEPGAFALSTSVHETVGRFTVALQVDEAPGQPVTVNIRIPDWAGGASLSLNGKPIPAVLENGYARIDRAWTAGDRLEAVFSLTVRVQIGQSLGQHVLVPGEAAVWYGPRLFSVNDWKNPTVRLHLAKINLPGDQTAAFRVISPRQIEAAGVTPDRPEERLILTPLAEIGGEPSGSGRIHTVRTPYYKVWIPVLAQDPH